MNYKQWEERPLSSASRIACNKIRKGISLEDNFFIDYPKPTNTKPMTKKSVSTFPIPEGFTVTDPVNFTCPFCQKRVTAGFYTALRAMVTKREPFAEEENGIVLHEEPACEKFVVNEPEQFMYLARVAMTGHDQSQS